jgi:hypothetical protein
LSGRKRFHCTCVGDVDQREGNGVGQSWTDSDTVILHQTAWRHPATRPRHPIPLSAREAGVNVVCHCQINLHTHDPHSTPFCTHHPPPPCIYPHCTKKGAHWSVNGCTHGESPKEPPNTGQGPPLSPSKSPSNTLTSTMLKVHLELVCSYSDSWPCPKKTAIARPYSEITHRTQGAGRSERGSHGVRRDPYAAVDPIGPGRTCPHIGHVWHNL